MTAAMERMLERKFNLTKSDARAVAKEARETLGIGKTLLWSATYERECLRIMEKNGVSAPEKPQFTWTLIPVESPQKSKINEDTRREQTSTAMTLSPTKSKRLNSARKSDPITTEPNSPSKDKSKAISSDPFSSPCNSPRYAAMKMIPSNSMKKLTTDSPMKMRPVTSPTKKQASMKRASSVGRMQTTPSSRRVKMQELDDVQKHPKIEKKKKRSKSLNTASMRQSPNQEKLDNDVSRKSPSKVKSRSKRSEKRTEDSSTKLPKTSKSKKIDSTKQTDFTSIESAHFSDNTDPKAEHHESIDSTRSTATGSSMKENSQHSPQRQKSPTKSMVDLLPPPPLMNQESIKKTSGRAVVSDSETRRSTCSRRDERSPKRSFQDNVTPTTRSKLNGSLSSSASPLRRRFPRSEEEENGPVNSEMTETRRATSSTRGECSHKLCQDNVTPTRSKLYGSLSSSTSPLRRRLPTNKEQDCLVNSEMETPATRERECTPQKSKIYGSLSSSASPLKRGFPNESKEQNRSIDSRMEMRQDSTGDCNNQAIGQNNDSSLKKESSLSSHLSRQCPKSETSDACAATVAETLSTSSNPMDESSNSNVQQLTARFEKEGQGQEVYKSPQRLKHPNATIGCF